LNFIEVQKTRNTWPRRSAYPERERSDFVAFFLVKKNGITALIVRKANRHLHEGDLWLFGINLNKQMKCGFKVI
jgi:hypothetical protein